MATGYNSELKKIDTEAKAYLLGFIYGDGSISNYIESTGRVRFLTRISISNIDKDLIEKLLQQFPFFKKGTHDYSKYNFNSNKQISISKSSKQLFEDLQDNGVFTRKSFENKNKLRLPVLDKDLMPHFIRGFFDADGSFFTLTNRPNGLRAEICGVSETFLKDLKKYLNSIGIQEWKLRTKNHNNKATLYALEIIKRAEVQKFITFIYSNASIYLNRKYNKGAQYRFKDKVIDRSIACPRCNSIKTWVNGERHPSIRFECTSCKKGFSIKKEQYQFILKQENEDILESLKT